MTTLALSLVVLSGLINATWNLSAKRIRSDASVVWLFYAVSTLLYAPVIATIFLLKGFHLTAVGVLVLAASAIVNLGYFVTLGRGYRAGDLSLVYPLARGTGPMLATLVAITVLGERPAPVALAGAVLVVLGAMTISGDPRRIVRSGQHRAVGYALLTGALIATYTLIDKQGVSRLGISPLLYQWGIIAIGGVFLTPRTVTRRVEVAEVWRNHWRNVLVIGVLSPISYVLALSALAISPVSYVAPAREIGVLFGALYGWRLLKERDAARRLVSAGAMVLGIVLLAVS